MKISIKNKIKYLGLLVLTSAFLVACGGDTPATGGGSGGGGGGGSPTPAPTPVSVEKATFEISLKQADDSDAMQNLPLLAVETTNNKEFVAQTDDKGVARFNLPEGTYQLSANGYFLADSAKNTYKVATTSSVYPYKTTITTHTIKGLSEVATRQLAVIIPTQEEDTPITKAEAYATFSSGFSATLQTKSGQPLAYVPVTLSANDGSFNLTYLTNAKGKVVFPNSDEPLFAQTSAKLSILIAGDGHYWFDGTTFVKDATQAQSISSSTASNPSIKLPDAVDVKIFSLSAKDANKANKPLDKFIITKMLVPEIPAKDGQPKVDEVPASDWNYSLTNATAFVNFLTLAGEYQVQISNFKDKAFKYFTTDKDWQTSVDKAQSVDLNSANGKLDLACGDCVASAKGVFAKRSINVQVEDAKAKKLVDGVVSLVDEKDKVYHFAVNAEGKAKVKLASGTYKVAYDTYYLEKDNKTFELKITPEEASFANSPSTRSEDLVLKLDTSKAFKVKLVNKSVENAPLAYVAVSLVSEKYPNMQHKAIADKDGVATFYESDKIIFLQDSKFKIKLHPVDLDISGNEKPLWVKTSYSVNSVTQSETSASSVSLSNKTLTVNINSADINNNKLVSLPLEFKDDAGNLRIINDFVVYDSDSVSGNRYKFVQKTDALNSKIGLLVYTGKRYALKKATENSDKYFYVEEGGFKGFKEVNHTKAKVFTVVDKAQKLQELSLNADNINPVKKAKFSDLVTAKTTQFYFKDEANNTSALDLEGFLLVNANDESDQHKIVTSNGRKTLTSLNYGQYYVVAKKHFVGEGAFVNSADKAKLYTIYKDSSSTQNVKIPINTDTGINFTFQKGSSGVKNVLLHIVDATSNTTKASFKTGDNGIAKIYSSQDFFIDKSTKYRVKVELLNLSKSAPVEYWFKEATSGSSSGTFVLGETNATKISLTQNYTGSIVANAVSRQINLDFSELKHFPSQFEIFTSSLYSKFKLPIFTDQISILMVTGSPVDSYKLRMPIYNTDGTSSVKYYSKNRWERFGFDASDLTPAYNSYSTETLVCKNSCGSSPKLSGTNKITTDAPTNVPYGYYESEIKVVSKDNKPLPNIGVVINSSSYNDYKFAETNSAGIAEFKQQNAVRNYADIYVLGKKQATVSRTYDYSSGTYKADKTIKLDFNADKLAKFTINNSPYVAIRLHKLKADATIDWSFDYQTRTDKNGVAIFYPTDNLTPDNTTSYKVSIEVVGDATYWFTGSSFSKNFSYSSAIKLISQDYSGVDKAGSWSSSMPSFGTQEKTINATDDKYNSKPIDGLIVGVVEQDSSSNFVKSSEYETFEYAPINYTDKARIVYYSYISTYYLTLPKNSSGANAKYYLNNGGGLDASFSNKNVIYAGASGNIDCKSDSCFVDFNRNKPVKLSVTVNEKSGSAFSELKVVAINAKDPSIQYQAVTDASGVAVFKKVKANSTYHFYVLGNFLAGSRSYTQKYANLTNGYYNSVDVGTSNASQTIQVDADKSDRAYLRVSQTYNNNWLKNVPVALYFKGTLYKSSTGPSTYAKFYKEIPGFSSYQHDVEAKLLTVGQPANYNMFDTSGTIDEKPGAGFTGGAPNINPYSTGANLTGHIGNFRKMLNITFVDKFGDALTPYELKACTSRSGNTYSNCDDYNSYLNTAFNLPVFGGFGSTPETEKVYLQVKARKEDKNYSYIDFTRKMVTLETQTIDYIDTRSSAIPNGTIKDYEFYCPRCNPAPVKE